MAVGEDVFADRSDVARDGDGLKGGTEAKSLFIDRFDTFPDDHRDERGVAIEGPLADVSYSISKGNGC